MIASNRSAASVEEKKKALDNKESACSRPENQARCDELDRAILARGTFRTMSVIGFAAAGSAAVATFVYTLVPGERRTPSTLRKGAATSTSIGASVAAAPGGARVGLWGRF
jgi:hypothetical protein